MTPPTQFDDEQTMVNGIGWTKDSRTCGTKAVQIHQVIGGVMTPPYKNEEKMEKEEGQKAFLCISACCLLSLDSQDLTAVVGTASLAGPVGHNGLAALGADRNAGSGQLPVGATALIAAGLGHFTLRDSHGDTSLVKLLFTA